MRVLVEMGNEATAGVKAPFLPPLYSSCLKNSLPPLHRELTPMATGGRRPHPLLTALPASPRRGPRWLPLMTALGRVAQGVSLSLTQLSAESMQDRHERGILVCLKGI